MEEADTDSIRSHHDAEDMIRLGKKQEYRRNFRIFANVSFAAVYSATWEITLVSTSGSLINGGFGELSVVQILI